MYYLFIDFFIHVDNHLLFYYVHIFIIIYLSMYLVLVLPHCPKQMRVQLVRFLLAAYGEEYRIFQPFHGHTNATTATKELIPVVTE